MKALLSKLTARVLFPVVAVLLFVGGNVFATTETITDVGDAAGYITAAILALGTIAGLVLGGFFGFWLVRKTFKWANKIG